MVKFKITDLDLKIGFSTPNLREPKVENKLKDNTTCPMTMLYGVHLSNK